MSKLIDSLTGYFFSGEHAAGHPSGTAAGRLAGTATVDAPAGNSAAAVAEGGAEGDSADLTPVAFKARAARAAVPSGAGASLRLRDRLFLRRPVRRTAGGTPASQKPWGDDEIASPRIHPLAVIDPRAELAADVEIGPFCVVGPRVTLGPGCKLHNNVTMVGHTTVGSDNEFFPNSVIGCSPQDKKYKGEETRLIIGDGNVVREHVTIHVGTSAGTGTTRLGDRNLLMVNAHLGHDLTLGSDGVIGNNVMVAGHCQIGDRVSMMGGSALHHFVSVGDFVFIGGYARIHHDVPPYVKVDAADEIRGVNVVGLRRGGMSDEDIAALEVVARRLFYAKRTPMSAVIAELMGDPNLNPRVREVVDFLRRRNLGTKGRYLESLRHA